MRIALDARECLDPATGMGRVASELVPRLLARGRHEWLLLVQAGAAVPPPLAGAPRLEVVAPPYGAREQLELPLALRRAGADHLHALTYALPLAAGIPASLTLYDAVPRLFPRGYRVRARLYWRLVLPFTARRAALIVAMTRAAAGDAARVLAIPHERFALVPPGVGAPFAPIGEAEIVATLRRLGIRRPYLLAHGNRRPHKNLVALVAAHSRLRREWPELALVFSGHGAPVSEPERARHDLGRVDDVTLAALYAGSAAYVLPSLYEGAGLTPLEAMACGAACVVSDRGGLPELYAGAALVSAPEPEPLAAAIAALLADPARARELRARGLALAGERSWVRTAEALEAALERSREAIARPSRSA